MKRVAIIGGGAAGLCCADALRRGAQTNAPDVTVFEQNDRVGKKLLVTGNGRCNLTNLHAAAADYSAPDFVAPAMTRFSPRQVLAFFESLSLFTRADSEGRVYPLSNQAAGVLDALRLEAARCGVHLKTGTAVETLRKSGSAWLVNGEAFDVVVLACGGKAGVKAHNGDTLLRAAGIPVTETAPGLVKLTTNAPAAKQLKGVRAGVNLVLRSGETTLQSERGELLFGDGVLSGIAAMNLSSAVNRIRMKQQAALTVDVDFVPEYALDDLLSIISTIIAQTQRERCEDLLSGLMPKAVGLMLLRSAGISPAKPTSQLTAAEQTALARCCKACAFPITGTKSYADAQITLGGAALDAFHPQTLEAKNQKHLFCVGELLDVDAPCGGYNLQWAFSSALLCADSILREVSHAAHQ